MWWAASDSWYSTSSPPATSRSLRAARSRPPSPGPAPVRDEHVRVGAWQVRLPVVDHRDEPGEGEKPPAPGGRAEARASTTSPSPSRSRRRSVRSGAIPVRSQASSWNSDKRAVSGVERVVVGIADPRHHVPVEPGPAAQRQRRPRGDDVQPALRVEGVAEPEQVVLVGATAVLTTEATTAGCRSRYRSVGH